MEVNNGYTYKRTKVQKCGKLPAKIYEEIPWNKLLVDLIDHMDLKNIYKPYYKTVKK